VRIEEKGFLSFVHKCKTINEKGDDSESTTERIRPTGIPFGISRKTRRPGPTREPQPTGRPQPTRPTVNTGGGPFGTNQFRTPLMKPALKLINKRLGFTEKNNISVDAIGAIISACHYDFSINGESPWCAVFTPQISKALEYEDDMFDLKEAHGSSFVANMSCAVIGDMVEKMKMAVKTPDVKRTFLEICHSSGMKPVVAGLGIFNDLKADKDYLAKGFSKSSNRQYRSSMVLPNGAYFAAVVHKCPKKQPGSSGLKVLTLWQETPIVIDGCDSEFCSMEQFLANYENKFETCDLAMCGK